MKDTQKSNLDYIHKIVLYYTTHYMNLDINARRNLEITEKLRDKSKKGSLLWVLDKTSTSMGGRLLRRWLNDPLIDVCKINERLEAVKELKEDIILRGDVIDSLKKVYDIERLAGKSVNDFDRLNKLSTFARLHQVYVVLKGAHTIIATPEGECYFNMTGNPGMAKGGAGDVLTGIIAALLASGHSPLDAAVIGVYAHGLAGDLVVEEQGMRGVRAGDIADKLGLVWKKMETYNMAKQR